MKAAMRLLFVCLCVLCLVTGCGDPVTLDSNGNLLTLDGSSQEAFLDSLDRLSTTERDALSLPIYRLTFGVAKHDSDPEAALLKMVDGLTVAEIIELNDATHLSPEVEEAVLEMQKAVGEAAEEALR